MRVTLTMQESEIKALCALAERECRDTRSQAVFIIRDELTRRGLLPAEPIQPTADPTPSPIQTAPAVMA